MSLSIPFRDRKVVKKKSLPDPRKFLRRGQGRWGNVEGKITKAGDNPPPATSKHTKMSVIARTEEVKEQPEKILSKSFQKNTVQSKIKDQILRSRRNRKNVSKEEIQVLFKPPPPSQEVKKTNVISTRAREDEEEENLEIVGIVEEDIQPEEVEGNMFDFDNQLEHFQQEEDDIRYQTAVVREHIQPSQVENLGVEENHQEGEDLDDLFRGDDLLDQLDQHLEPAIFEEEESWMKQDPLLNPQNEPIIEHSEEHPELESLEANEGEEIAELPEDIEQPQLDEQKIIQDEVDDDDDDEGNFEDDPLLKDLSVSIPEGIGSFADDSGPIEEKQDLHDDVEEEEEEYETSKRDQTVMENDDVDPERNISPLSKRCFIPPSTEPRNVMRSTQQIPKEENEVDLVTEEFGNYDDDDNMFIGEVDNNDDVEQPEEEEDYNVGDVAEAIGLSDEENEDDDDDDVDVNDELEEPSQPSNEEEIKNKPIPRKNNLVEKYFLKKKKKKGPKRMSAIQRRLMKRKEEESETKHRETQLQSLEKELQHFRQENERLLAARSRLSVEKQRITHESTEFRRKYEQKVKEFDKIKEREWRRIQREKKVLAKQSRLRLKAGKVDGLEKKVKQLEKQLEDERARGRRDRRNLRLEVDKYKKKFKDLEKENSQLKEKLKKSELRRIDREFTQRRKKTQKSNKNKEENEEIEHQQQKQKQKQQKQEKNIGHDDYLFQETTEDEENEEIMATTEDTTQEEEEEDDEFVSDSDDEDNDHAIHSEKSLLEQHFKVNRRKYLPDPNSEEDYETIEKLKKGNNKVKRKVELEKGKVEFEFYSGRKEIRYPNGTVKKKYPSGHEVVFFNNGDIQRTFTTGKVDYYFKTGRTTHSTYPNKLQVIRFPTNQVEYHYPDGSKEIVFPDLIKKYIDPKGRQEIVKINGSAERL